MKKSILSMLIIAITKCYADTTTVNLNALKLRNESQLSQVSTNFGSLSNKNINDMADANIESARNTNKMQIDNLKITGSNMPHIDMSKVVANKIDINELIKKSQLQLSKDPANTDISLYLSFTTLDKDTVLLYAAQAVKYRIPVVLRGFINNSYQETSKYIRQIRELFPELTILIDPPAYEKYDITEVPTLVVTKEPNSPTKDGCAAPGNFSKVSGEVSIQALLDYVRLNSRNQILVAAATQRLNNVREKRYFKID